jgi:hypothetical protein
VEGFAIDWWQWAVHKFGQELALFILWLVSIIGLAVIRFLIRQIQRALCFLHSRQRTLNAVGRKEDDQGKPEGDGVWLTRPINAPINYQRLLQTPKVLSIANLREASERRRSPRTLARFWLRNGPNGCY